MPVPLVLLAAPTLMLLSRGPPPPRSAGADTAAEDECPRDAIDGGDEIAWPLAVDPGTGRAGMSRCEGDGGGRCSAEAGIRLMFGWRAAAAAVAAGDAGSPGSSCLRCRRNGTSELRSSCDCRECRVRRSRPTMSDDADADRGSRRRRRIFALSRPRYCDAAILCVADRVAWDGTVSRRKSPPSAALTGSRSPFYDIDRYV